MNSDWHRAVLRKYEPPVSFRPGDFVRSRLSGTARMFSAGFLRLNSMSMPFAEGFLQGREMDSVPLHIWSGSPVPGYRAALAPGERAGFFRLNPFHKELRRKVDAAAPGDISFGLREGNSLVQPNARRSPCLEASSGNGNGPARPVSPGSFPGPVGAALSALKNPIPARRPMLPVIFRKAAKGEGYPYAHLVVNESLVTRSGVQAGRFDINGRSVSVRGALQMQGGRHEGASPVLQTYDPEARRTDAVPPLGYLQTLQLKQGDVPQGKGRMDASGKGPAGRGRGAMSQGARIFPGTLQMKGGVLSGRHATGRDGVNKEVNAGGRMSSSLSREALFLQGKAPLRGRVSADRKAMPLFGKSAPAMEPSTMDLADRTGTVKIVRISGISGEASGHGVPASEPGPLLQPSAMGIRPRPALLEHVAQRVAQGGRVNATSLVLQSRAVRARAGSLAREVAGRAGSGPGAAVVFSGQTRPGISPERPASRAVSPGGLSSRPALLQVQETASSGQGVPSSFIFRERAMDMPDISGSTSGQQAPYMGDGGAGVGPFSSQAPLAGGVGVGQEVESGAGLPVERSPGEVDIERLADEVYLILERRLEREKESRGL